MSLREAAQQALEALEGKQRALSQAVRLICEMSQQPLPPGIDDDSDAITALRAALAEPEQEPQTTHWEGCEAVHPECRKPEQKAWFTIPEANEWAAKLPQPEHEVKNLSNYEFKTYKTGGAELEAGFYSTDELRDLVKALDKMNAATERHMRRMK